MRDKQRGNRKMQINIGKNGLKEGFFELLKNAFKKRENIKVVLLKAAGHTKENAKQIAENIISRLGKNYTYRIVGFTIFLKKWRKLPKQFSVH